MGRGVVAGSEIFWPTRREIYVLNAATGARTRSPINLELLESSGANLAVGQGRLIAAGPEKLMVFGPSPANPESTAAQPAQVSISDFKIRSGSRETSELDGILTNSATSRQP
jgi:hypothetical protein